MIRRNLIKKNTLIKISRVTHLDQIFSQIFVTKKAPESQSAF